MKRTLAALLVGIALGSTGLAFGAASRDSWQRNNITCTTTGSGVDRGITCARIGSRSLVIVNQRQIIVGRGSRALYITSSR
jgi:hypothetical protein